MQLGMTATLFVYAFLSNVAVAVIPHEPVVAWYGPRLGILTTALVSTAATVVASCVDYLLFARLLAARSEQPGLVGSLRRSFNRAPLAILTLSGLTPLPFWPFKALAFSNGYPLGRYLGAVALGRFPRYALLAWLGALTALPTWVLPLVAVVMLGAWAISTARRAFSRPSHGAAQSTNNAGTTDTTTSSNSKE